MIHKGDRVFIKAEYQDKGDCLHRFIAVQDEDCGRVLVETQIPKWTIYPTAVIPTYMLELSTTSESNKNEVSK